MDLYKNQNQKICILYKKGRIATKLANKNNNNNINCENISIVVPNTKVTSLANQMQAVVNLTPANTNEEVIWHSSDPSVIRVSDKGLLTFISNGQATITATCGQATDSVTITVEANESSVGIQNILIDRELVITDKNYFRIEAITVPAEIPGTFYWSTDNASVVGVSTVNSSGNQTLLPGKNGKATLTVTFNGTDPAYYLRKKFEITVDLIDNTPDVPILYNNPTITVEGVKAKAVSGNAVQYFDLSYMENDGHPSFEKSKVLTDADGNTYYLALTKKGTSQFGIDGLHLDSGAWTSESSRNGQGMYTPMQSVLAWFNWDYNYTVRNVNNSVPKELLDKALFNLNQTLPALNVTESQSSLNTIILDEIDDAYLGFCGKFADKNNFYINLNLPVINRIYGKYTPENTQWLSTCVHELGHCLGTRDEAAHEPSMYSYGRDTYKCTYLQPNDIAWIEYIHKEQYGVDIMTTQENIQAQIAAMEEPVEIVRQDEFAFDYIIYDDPEKEADLIVYCKLKFNENKVIEVAKDFELEYKIYDIIEPNVLKGIIANEQVKIHVSQNLDICEDIYYRLYLKQYENKPCSLINPYQGIVKL
jgi:hypothetical protein